MPVIQLGILGSRWWLVDPHKSGWTEAAQRHGMLGLLLNGRSGISERKGLPSKQCPFLSAGHRPTANCSRSFVRARKGPQSRREIREGKQNFHYGYKAQCRCPAICFGHWTMGIRLARSVRFCLVSVFSRWSIVVLQKRIVAQLITKFFASFRTWRFNMIIWKLSFVHSVYFLYIS